MSNVVDSALEEALGVYTPGADQLKDLAVLVNKAVGIKSQIDEAEEYVKSLKQELRTLEMNQIPLLMAEAGVSEFKTDDGSKVTIKDIVSGSLPKDPMERQKALEWIESQDAGDLIKNTVAVELGRGSHNEAGAIKDFLHQMGVEFKSDETVHPQTLAAWARERMKKGEDVPADLLGLFIGRAAKINPAKG
jgi:hypothetical protein